MSVEEVHWNRIISENIALVYSCGHWINTPTHLVNTSHSTAVRETRNSHEIKKHQMSLASRLSPGALYLRLSNRIWCVELFIYAYSHYLRRSRNENNFFWINNETLCRCRVGIELRENVDCKLRTRGWRRNFVNVIIAEWTNDTRGIRLQRIRSFLSWQKLEFFPEQQKLLATTFFLKTNNQAAQAALVTSIRFSW